MSNIDLFKLSKDITEIRLEEVVLGYHGIQIKNKFSFNIKPGSMVGVLGSNGSGKTTFLKTLAGIIPVLSGDVIIDRCPLQSLANKCRAKITSYLPQIDNQYVDFSVQSMIYMSRYAYQNHIGEKDFSTELLYSILDYFNLLSLKDKPVRHLSGGQFQRVLLARHLMQQVPIHFLDEPSNHLDPYYQELLQKSIRSLRENHHTIFISTHQLDWVIENCTHAIIMNEHIPNIYAMSDLNSEILFQKIFYLSSHHIHHPFIAD